MENLKLSIYDKGNVLDQTALSQSVQKHSDILEAAKEGEALYSDSQGWLHVDEWAGEEWLERYENLAKQVQENADVLVVIGIGGSNQAARAVVDCIGEKGDTKIVWAGNSISAYSMQESLSQLTGKRVYIDVIAKNFETLEPGIAFRVLRAWLKEQYGDSYADHVICTGTEGSSLYELCKVHGYTFLPFPKDIGGRFTALSPVGLFPLAVAGMDIRAMAKGAAQMRQQLCTVKSSDNMALTFACARNQLYDQGYRMEMLSYFEPRLYRFSRWWMQLFGESEGKDDKGLYPLTGCFSEDLHSIGQFIQSGTPVLYEVFLDVQNTGASCKLGGTDIEDGFTYLDGWDFDEINRAAFQGTVAAHSGRFPCFVISIPALDEYSFGQLFYFFEFTCYLSGKILGVNPFDQPGVEAYKNQMFEILGKKK